MFLDLETTSLSLAVLGSATGAIIASYQSRWRRAFLALKPLATILILAIVLSSTPGSDNRYALIIAIALLFSLAGDVILMLSSRYFALGILSFAVTHVLYFAAFAMTVGLALVRPVTLVFGAIALAIARLTWRGVSRSLRAAVFVYVLLITAMVAQATGAAIEQAAPATAIAAAGAVSFFVSDAILAIDRFRTEFSSARALTLASYWLGQWLIAMSTRIQSAAA